ncbi:MAG TPA: tetratricopeptide repeat protein [Candidatus Tumulicola sp.]|nr:tetratricopeptide repeat protein [Candidatus Tumulicola sp.]
MSANKKLEQAIAVAAKEGLRASVPAYMAAAEAFAQEQRHATGVEMLGQLLLAVEKKHGFLARVDKNPLGPERPRVAMKFAELSRLASPTEDSLEILEDLSLEFPDVVVIRRANADALRNAGYAADAIEEYRYCRKLEPKDGEIAVRLADLYAALGRIDEAIEHLRHGIELFVARSEYRQAAEHAMRFLDLHADGVDDALASFTLIPADVLRTQCASLDHIGVVIRRDQTRKPEWRQERERILADLYAKILELDKKDQAARRGLAALGPSYLKEVEALIGTLPPAEAARPAPATPAPAPPIPVARAVPEPAVVEPPQPDMVEASQGELIEPDVAVHEIAEATPTTQARPVTPAPAAAAAPVAPEKVQVPPAPMPEPKPVPAPPQPPVVTAEPVAASVEETPERISPAVAPTGKTAAPNKALATFALRKAQQLFADGSLEEAAQACERVLKHGEDITALTILMNANLGLKRNSDAVAACIRLADAQVAAGSATAALETLTRMAKTVPEPQLILRRSQLLTRFRGPEVASKS